MKTVMMIVIAMVMATGRCMARRQRKRRRCLQKSQPEVLTRGPVNEAFAQPVNLEDQAGFLAPTEPPDQYRGNSRLPEKARGRTVCMGAGLLGVGFGQEWVYLGKRVLASGTAGYVLDAGLLGQSCAEVGNGWRDSGCLSPIIEIEYLPAPPALTRC